MTVSLLTFKEIKADFIKRLVHGSCSCDGLDDDEGKDDRDGEDDDDDDDEDDDRE